jgi:hypothetical protein
VHVHRGPTHCASLRLPPQKLLLPLLLLLLVVLLISVS